MCRHFLFLILLLTSIGCQRALIPAPSITEETQTNGTVLVPGIKANQIYNGVRYVEDVSKFYERRHHRPFWIEKNIPSARADSLISIIRSARQYGLLPQHYHVHEISKLTLLPLDELRITRLDVILTDAFLSIAHDLKMGRTRNLNFSSTDSVHVYLLTDSIEAHEIESALNKQEPQYVGYELLKRALNMILDSVNLTDQNFLMRGITIDSIEIHRKIQSIEINLERWRNENAELDKTYTWINIPSYMFNFIENHKVVMESSVVVGAPSTPTPIFSSNIECFTIFPYWYMPRKIAVLEYLPVIKRDTSFLSRNNFDVLDRTGKIQDPRTIDWKKYNENNFPFTLRQREGKENSLGIIKFVFDNPYAVFLHDTNSKKLFKHKVRAYSHGCIRLEKAVEFAHYLIGGNRTNISSRTLNKYLGDQKRLTISLFQPIPIHIRYFTCEVKDGELLFYSDIYKKDPLLINTLYNQDTL